MRVSESYLIEPMLPADQISHVQIPESLHKQEYQIIYANQLLNKISNVGLSSISKIIINYKFVL